MNVSNPTGLRVATTAPNPDRTVSGIVWVVAWVDGATAPSTVTLTVAGTVVKSVTASSMPVSLDWDSRLTPNGAQTLTVAARDAAGKTGSASLSVTVANAGAPPPPLTASFTSPAGGATVSGNVTIGMAVGGASGSSNTFRLTLDGAPASTQTVATTSTSFTWNTAGVANGTHTLGLTASDAAGRSATATLTVTVNNAAAPPPPPPPAGGTLKVAMTSPNPGATVNGVVWVTVWVSGASGASTVSLSVAGATVRTLTSSSMPMTLIWDSQQTPDGPQTLTAIAHDATGNTGSASMNLTVANGAAPAPPPPPPLGASFTSPANGASISGNVAVGMAASGASGSISYRLAVDGTIVSTETTTATTASYLWNTTTVGNGSHTLALTVTDSAGRTASATITVSVNNATAPPPPPPPPTSGTLTIAFTAPNEGETVRGTVWMVIWANGASGSSNTFTVSVGGTVIKTQTTSGASVTIPWDTVGFANGPQTINATVRDATGNTGSGARSVVLAN